MELQIGSRVIINPESFLYTYGGEPDPDNPIDTIGTITLIEEEEVAGYKEIYYSVHWNNGGDNVYIGEDLMLYEEESLIKHNYQIF